MRTLKMITVWILGIALILLLAIGGGAIWVFNNPEKTIELTKKHLLPEDLSVTWKDLRIDPKYLGGLNFSLDIDVRDLLIQRDNLNAPIDHIRLLASFYFSKSEKHRIDELVVLAPKDITITPTSKNKTDSEDEQNVYQQAAGALSQLGNLKEDFVITKVDMDISKISISSTNPLSVSFKASKEDTQKLDFGITLNTASKLNVSLKGDVNFEEVTEGPLLKSNLNVTSPFMNTQLPVEVFFDNDQIELNTYGDLRFKTGQSEFLISPNVKIVLQPESAKIQIATDVSGIPGPLKKIRNINIRIDMPLEEDALWSDDATTVSVTGPVDLFFVKERTVKQIEASCACDIPGYLNAHINGKIWLSKLLATTDQSETVVEVDYNLDEVQNKLFRVDLRGSLKVIKENEAFSYVPNLNSSINIYSFQSILKLLESNQLTVPTPFNVLDGKIDFYIRGNPETDSRVSTFPMELSVDLASSDQKVKLNSTAMVALDRSFKKADVSVNAEIEDIRLILPPLDPIRGTPRVIKDARILKTPKDVKKSDFVLNFDFKINTQKPGAIKLFHEYFKPYLPITLQMDSKNSAGDFVKVEPFDIVYLRRRLSVKHLNLDLSKAEQEVLPIDLRLQVNQTQYTVFIDVKGNLKDPQIILSSDPYLPENDIIAVLLYDQTTAELGAGDAETSAGVQSAIANRALGLFGLWAFAATPIKRFSYNPVTKVYSAAIEVSDSVTAEIGTNWEETTNLEVHKRLSRRWVLTAAWTPATTDTRQTQKIILQWERRF